MFDLRDFLKSGFIMAVGKMADYKIILNAAGWYDKGVLTDADLAEIQTTIDDKNARLAAESETEITEQEESE